MTECRNAVAVNHGMRPAFSTASHIHQKPQPISAEEARGVLQRAGEIKGDRGARNRQSFTQGEQVKIIEGPFESFTGSIEEVNLEKNKLKVMVGIFGRATPVEVDMLQVEKI